MKTKIIKIKDTLILMYTFFQDDKSLIWAKSDPVAGK